MLSLTLPAHLRLQWAALSCAALVWLTPLLSASAHYCRFKKGDEKNICLAQKEDTTYFCRYVRNAQQKSYCLAWTLGNPQRCERISDPALKSKCTAEAVQRDALLKQKAAAEQAKRDAERARQQASQPAQPTSSPSTQP